MENDAQSFKQEGSVKQEGNTADCPGKKKLKIESQSVVKQEGEQEEAESDKKEKAQQEKAQTAAPSRPQGVWAEPEPEVHTEQAVGGRVAWQMEAALYGFSEIEPYQAAENWPQYPQPAQTWQPHQWRTWEHPEPQHTWQQSSQGSPEAAAQASWPHEFFWPKAPAQAPWPQQVPKAPAQAPWPQQVLWPTQPAHRPPPWLIRTNHA